MRRYIIRRTERDILKKKKYYREKWSRRTGNKNSRLSKCGLTFPSKVFKPNRNSLARILCRILFHSGIVDELDENCPSEI